MDNSGWNMYVFRDGRRIVSGQRLVSELRVALEALAAESRPGQDRVLDALITAGELECALADAGSPASEQANNVSAAAGLTDDLAEMLVSSGTGQDSESCRHGDPTRLLAKLESVSVPPRLQVSVHEGFAYYALHPLKLVDLLQTLPLPRDTAVMGIRSIGVTLSAVLVAALRHRGCAADRLSVRPEGHPYERKLALTAPQKAWVERHRDGQFMVVDEGPGLSGSSFLAVAEALAESGIPSQRILLIGSRQPDPAQLRSPNAVERWNRFRFTCLASAPHVPAGAIIPISGGQWRDEFLTGADGRPASWAQLEMAKFLSADRKLLYKFEGFGHFGGEIGKRARTLAAAGLAPEYLGNECGFGIYAMNSGRFLTHINVSAELSPQPMENRHCLGTPELLPQPMENRHCLGTPELLPQPMENRHCLGTPELLRHLARYCAFRVREFPADDSQPSALDEMASWNWSLEFGSAPGPRPLEVERRVFCDARMMPHEWLACPDGRLLKLDGVAHGDDHFFPGPCDIAWDLAGTIIEWKLQPAVQEFFLQEYRRLSEDDARRRLPSYLQAYAAFRFGWSKMAALASAGTPDEPLLWQDFHRYRAIAASLCPPAVPPEVAPVQAVAAPSPEDKQPARLDAA